MIESAPIRTALPAPAESDVRDLAAELSVAIEGEVRFDRGSRALYATDGSVYRQVPKGVVVPRTIEDVVQTVSIACQHGAPILPRGGGTSLKGQCCNVAIVIDFSKYLNGILQFDPERKMAVVEPGTVCDQVRKAAAPHDLTFGPDPATHTHSTIGGQIGNNSCGIHSVMAGRTSDNLEEMEVLTYDGLRMRVGPTTEPELESIIAQGGRRGDIYRRLRDLRDRYGNLIRERYPNIPRRISGYNLDELLPEKGFNVARALCATDGTCAVVLQATLRLIDWPPVRTLLVLGYPDAYAAGDHVPQVMEGGPMGLEGFERRMVEGMQKKRLHVENLGLLPDGDGWLLAEFGGASREEAIERAQTVMDHLRQSSGTPEMKLVEPEEAGKIWQIRESAVGAVSYVPGEQLVWPTWEDSAVPPDKVGVYLRDLRKLANQHGYDCSFFGHFGQGCIHARFNFDLQTAPGIKNFRSFLEKAADLVVSYGGSLSGEHGDGQALAELLPRMFGPELVEAFREFKYTWDPQGKVNPGKVVDAYRLDDNLRLGAGYSPAEPKTVFQYPEDRFSFAHAQLRCIGVGECRRHESGTMCPSYMVTREEKHSTRGRARLLWEMLQGDPLQDGWRSEPVKEALDLCLACKGCKGDCPVQVDMATYKAEFLAHYYAGRLRPRSAYAMGLVFLWARLASNMPGLVNFASHAPGISRLLKLIAGVDPRRELPAFAPETFQHWFRNRPARGNSGQQVLLWPDTFNNHFHPEIARAAVEVLERSGCQVIMPLQPFCCGRPLYDYGMLDQAKRALRQVVSGLREQIRAGVPVVVLEPSCLAVFRDELINLFPRDQDAVRLSQQSYLLSEFLEQRIESFEPPKLERKAIVHGHCHHKAIAGFKDEQSVLEKLGLDFEVLDSGCCGMAGSFGFEAGEHYEVAMKCGERVLLPSVRGTPDDMLIIADGFSCQEQIRQAAGRHALHLADVLRMAFAQSE